MSVVAAFSLIIPLAILIIEDFYNRSVHWWLFLLITLALLNLNFLSDVFMQAFKDALVNIGFVLLQVTLATIYFSIRKRKLVNIFNEHFGIGDLLFLISISFAFSSLNFIVFYVISLIFIVILFFMIMSVKGNFKEYLIPLAGAQALFFIPVFALDWFSTKVDLHDDSRLLNWLTGL